MEDRSFFHRIRTTILRGGQFCTASKNKMDASENPLAYVNFVTVSVNKISYLSHKIFYLVAKELCVQ